MTETKVKIMAVYNIYDDVYVDLVCKFEVHTDKKGEFDGANLISIVSNEGIELMGYLNADNIPAEVESNFVEAFK